MDLKILKAAVQKSIDARAEEIMEIADKIYKNPETGFREHKTAALVAGEFRKISEQISVLQDIPGVKITLDTGRPGPGIAILGEMDALLCPDHPDADPDTKAMHACGHNQQVAAMIGALQGIWASEAHKGLVGKLHFIAVPAEECIEVGFRRKLREQGVISYFTGKAELLSRGFFDDVDLCLLSHASTRDCKFSLTGSFNGSIVKRIRYLGKAAHAGGSPHLGINALYAANLGLMGINALREGFKEADHIRIHPIITKGGDSVNVIPSEVCLETFLRGGSLEAIKEANAKVNNALLGGAIALGAQVEIEDFAGYLPLVVDDQLFELTRLVVEELADPEEIIVSRHHSTGSTDMGDLSSLMPVLQSNFGSVQGSLHGDDYKVADPTMVVLAAKLLALSALELLGNDAKQAREILANYKPLFNSREEYFAEVDGLFSKKLLGSADL